MALSPQSIRSNILIQMNGEHVKKEVIIALSASWNEKQLSYFRKILKQGGALKINGDHFEIEIGDSILNSRGEKDGGTFKVPGPDDRF